MKKNNEKKPTKTPMPAEQQSFSQFNCSMNEDDNSSSFTNWNREFPSPNKKI